MTTGDEYGERAIERSALIGALRVLRERWWLVAASVVVCLGITLGLTLTSTKQYKTTATLLIRTSNLTSLIDPTQPQTQDAARAQGDNLSLIQSGAVAQRVKNSLHLSASLADLLAKVDAVAQPDTDLLSVSITDPSPGRAATLANAFANALVGYLRDSDQARIAAGQAAINAQIAHLSPQDAQSRAVLEQALSRVIALRAVTSGDADVVDPATVPTAASSPQVKRDAAAGGLIGIVLGVTLAFLLDLFDRRVKSVEELERLYGLPALTTAPWRKPATNQREHQAELEPFRILRDGLASISLREDPRVILVTSAISSEGKTKVAIGLAHAFAVAGRQVALVEVDLHRPTIARNLDLEYDGQGLTNALVAGVSVPSLMRPVPRVPSLSVLPSGPLTPNSAELLRSAAMTNILVALAEMNDFVVLDGPPLLPVADAQVLLDNAVIDVCLVVARPHLTTRDDVRGALAVLKRHSDKGVGLVVNGAREASSGYYYPAGSDRPGSTNGAARGRRGLGQLIGIRPRRGRRRG
jgi:polysaccharide biosynthesis transport protein